MNCDKKRNQNRCHIIKEELMKFVWNPERPFTKWALSDEFKFDEEKPLIPCGGAGF